MAAIAIPPIPTKSSHTRGERGLREQDYIYDFTGLGRLESSLYICDAGFIIRATQQSSVTRTCPFGSVQM